MWFGEFGFGVNVVDIIWVNCLIEFGFFCLVKCDFGVLVECLFSSLDILLG